MRVVLVIVSMVLVVGCKGDELDRARRERDAYRSSRRRICSGLSSQIRLAGAPARLAADDPRLTAERWRTVQDGLMLQLHVDQCAVIPAEVGDALMADITDTVKDRERTLAAARLLVETLAAAEAADWTLPPELTDQFHLPRQASR